MNWKHVAHILLFVLTVFVTIPAVCDTAFADILSVEYVSDNEMDPQSLEADDLAHTGHIYISKPEPITDTAVDRSGGLTFTVPPLWWRPPMHIAA